MKKKNGLYFTLLYSLSLFTLSFFSLSFLHLPLPEDGLPETDRRELGSAEKEKWGVEDKTGGERIVPW